MTERSLVENLRRGTPLENSAAIEIERQRGRAQNAAHIIAEILAATLMQAEREGRQLYIWESQGIEWLREQWKIDPETSINMWTADRYVRNGDVQCAL